MKLNVLTIFSCFLAVFMISCRTQEKSSSNTNQWLPSDLNPGVGILLVQKMPIAPRAERKIEEYVAEHYPFKYEFVDLKTIDSYKDKYKDTTIYRYALRLSNHTTYYTNTDGSRSNMRTSGWNYYFYNRTTGKRYPEFQRSYGDPLKILIPGIKTIVEKYQ